MPKSAENKIKRQGGTVRYRTMKKGDETFTVAITKKKGPKGGRTVAWERESLAPDLVNRLLEDEPSFKELTKGYLPNIVDLAREQARRDGLYDNLEPGCYALADIATDAVEYLNSLETREGYFWTVDDNSLFLVSENEEYEFR